MMDRDIESFKKQIHKLIGSNGSNGIDTLSLKGLLADFIHNQKKRNLLNISLESGIIDHIQTSQIISNLSFIKQCKDTLRETYGIADNYAEWVARVWLYIFNKGECPEDLELQEGNNKEQTTTWKHPIVSYSGIQNGQPTTNNKKQMFSPWPMFRGNVQRTGLSPFDTSTNTGKLKWKYKLDELFFSSIAIGADGTIYIGASKHLYAIDPYGKLKCKYELECKSYSDPAIGADGTIYTTANDTLIRSCIYAIDPYGKLKWKYEESTYGRLPSSIAIGADGTIYIGVNRYLMDIGSASKHLYAIDPYGKLKWKYELDCKSYSDPAIADPAIGADGTIYIGENKHLYAIDPYGKLKWKYGSDYESYSYPAIGSDGTIYIKTGSELHAIDPYGKLKWKYELDYKSYSYPAIGADGTIYIGENKHLYAIDPYGKLKWKYGSDYESYSYPAIGSDGTIYIKTGSELHAIDPYGKLKWKYELDGPFFSYLAIGSDGTIYITEGRHLYAIK